jgi:hypothetical protein
MHRHDKDEASQGRILFLFIFVGDIRAVRRLVTLTWANTNGMCSCLDAPSQRLRPVDEFLALHVDSPLPLVVGRHGIQVVDDWQELTSGVGEQLYLNKI